MPLCAALQPFDGISVVIVLHIELNTREVPVARSIVTRCPW